MIRNRSISATENGDQTTLSTSASPPPSSSPSSSSLSTPPKHVGYFPGTTATSFSTASSTKTPPSVLCALLGLFTLSAPLIVVYWFRSSGNPLLGIDPDSSFSSSSSSDDPLRIVQWNGAGVWAGLGVEPIWPEPNYVGHDVHRTPCSKKCEFLPVYSFESTASKEPSQGGGAALSRAAVAALLEQDESKERGDALNAAELALHADAVLLEWMPAVGGRPVLDHYDYARNPPRLPERRSGQPWINFGFETSDYFPILGEPLYASQFDVNSTQQRAPSQVPLTYACAWGGDAEEQARETARHVRGDTDDSDRRVLAVVNEEKDAVLRRNDQLKIDPDVYRRVPPSAMGPARNRSKLAAFMASNCVWGGADRRTEYVAELMRHMSVDSFGRCLHNAELPPAAQVPVYDDHGLSMRIKTEVFRGYRFVLAFENGPQEDYVSEKVFNAILAGSLPVYLGTDLVDDFLPSPKAVVKASDFNSAKELAEYLLKLDADDDAYAEHFAWKQQPLPDSFLQQYSRCAFYGADCRLCEYLHKQRDLRRHSSHSSLEELKSPAASVGKHLLFENFNWYVALSEESAAADTSDLSSSSSSSSSIDKGTVSLWVFAEAVHKTRHLLFDSENVALALVRGDDGFKLHASIKGQTSSLITVRDFIFDDDWTHISVTWQWSDVARRSERAEQVQVFVDGRLLDALHELEEISTADTSDQFSPLSKDDSDNDSSAAAVAVLGLGFRGRLDDVLLFRRILSATEARRVLFERLTSSAEHAWRFDHHLRQKDQQIVSSLSAGSAASQATGALSSSASDYVLIFDESTSLPLYHGHFKSAGTIITENSASSSLDTARPRFESSPVKPLRCPEPIIDKNE